MKRTVSVTAYINKTTTKRQKEINVSSGLEVPVLEILVSFVGLGSRSGSKVLEIVSCPKTGTT